MVVNSFEGCAMPSSSAQYPGGGGGGEGGGGIERAFGLSNELR